LKIDRLVKYLSWFEIQFEVVIWNYKHLKFEVGVPVELGYKKIKNKNVDKTSKLWSTLK